MGVIVKEVPLFKEYAQSWIDTTAPATCKASTVSDYGRILESHVLPVFGDHAVDKITKGKIKDFLLGKVNEVPITRSEETAKEPSEWVFTNGLGGLIDVNNWRRWVFNKALKKAGLRKIRIHDLRHTYASLLIQGSESLAYVRDQLGHHSIKVTVDIYGHLAPEGNKQAMDKLDDVLPVRLDAPSPHPVSSENKQALKLFSLSA